MSDINAIAATANAAAGSLIATANPNGISQTTDREAIRAKAEEFEAVFLSQMLAPMFEGIEAEAPFGGGAGEEMWRSMLINEYGGLMASKGGVGIADAVERQLLQLQEV